MIKFVLPWLPLESLKPLLQGMALWILNRPPDKCHPAEVKTAEYLASLNNDWVIRWGFYYKDNAGETREGDFLVLGPHGGLMVLEVKAGSLDTYHGSGQWGTRGGDNPLFQLDAEWKAVVNTVNEHRKGRPGLYVTRALALPDLEMARNVDSYHGIPRDMILCGGDLKRFPAAWKERFEKHRPDKRSQEIFFDTYGKDATPKEVKRFMSHVDGIIARHTAAKYLLLDQLQDNLQFLMSGGPGSGKTWLAFELACRWAKRGERVLMLAYNLAFTACLKQMAEHAVRRKLIPADALVVFGWEELARELFSKAGLSFDLPDDVSQHNEFYARVVPDLMAEIAGAESWTADFDALVVDEAQDHNTVLDGQSEPLTGPGWWGIYLRLLKGGVMAPIAAFYDSAQRPDFRDREQFDPDSLARALQANPVRVRLPRTVRYTRQIFEYLKSLDCETTRPLSESLNSDGDLPEGPPVQRSQVSIGGTVVKLERIVSEWLKRKLCRPDDILILSRHGRRSKSCLAELSEFAGCQLADYLVRKDGEIGFTSVHKAKGLDSLAVILVDFNEFSDLDDPVQQGGFFMGASRARQLLAVVFEKTGE